MKTITWLVGSDFKRFVKDDHPEVVLSCFCCSNDEIFCNLSIYFEASLWIPSIIDLGTSFVIRSSKYGIVDAGGNVDQRYFWMLDFLALRFLFQLFFQSIDSGFQFFLLLFGFNEFLKENFNVRG